MPNQLAWLPRHAFFWSLFALVASFWLHFASSVRAQDAQSDEFKIQGEYSGSGLGLQVIAVGDDEFEFALYAGGLPGAGWDRSPPQRADGDAEAVQQLIEARKLKPVVRTSPTLGAKPPAGAVVLFDGSASAMDNWQPGAKRSDDGLLMAGATSRQTFGDYTLHLEFQTPFMPKADGQARGNSGVYHQGRYETQILDSFGLEGKDNEAGGIYSVRDPDLNMCLPPLSWQTYDVDFTAPRFDEAGKKIANAVLTVRLNGVAVQSDVPVPGPTTAAPLAESNQPGPIYLQDHGNPVRFRNIWLVPRDAQREATRPRLPGFERFFAQGDTDSDVIGGRLLIAQLGCAACHKTDEPAFQPKSAPILSNVGARIRLDHLVSFIGQPHAAKPGTTMPDLMRGLSDQQRAEVVSQLVSFLSSTGQPIDRPGDSAAQARGEKLYQAIGCAACHTSRPHSASSESTSVPLPNLVSKYTLDSLTKFLANPHAVRTSGLMPKLVSNLAEARDLACYLLGEAIIVPGAQQFNAVVYHGTWDKLPKFESLEPIKRGTTAGLDLSLAERKDNFAMVFEGYLKLDDTAEYQLFLGSDDGSRLLIDDEEVISVDGVHPFEFKPKTKRLAAGMHRVRVEYFELGGEERLEVEIEGPNLGRIPLAMLVSASSDAQTKPLLANKFVPASTLKNSGSQTFQKLGCAACHTLQIDGQTLSSTLPAPPLNSLKSDRGCLAEKLAPQGVPDFALSPAQRRAIRAALQKPGSGLSDEQEVHLTLASFNCYACHSRQKFGGPEPARDALFTTSVQEMGNEARIPPLLTGVGDKLRGPIIERIIAEGAKDRPYMLTRMPAFAPAGDRTAWATLRGRFEKLDAHVPHPDSIASGDQVAATTTHEAALVDGRKLVGSNGLACIKCHTYGQRSTPGIQAIDMLTMSERLRPDWFQRYMLAPAEYRPGTRMPLSFPEGKSVLTGVLAGNAKEQIKAMWLYLSEGKQAKPPSGLEGEAIVLVPEQQPIIYRNFIEGLGPRGIAVGYPQRVNLAWDAGTMNLGFVWKNDFIDAAKHWVGRGPGNQGPAGDFIIKFDAAVPLSRLDSPNAPWPRSPTQMQSQKLGYRFGGYDLDAHGQPTFNYTINALRVSDKFTPVRGEDSVGFERRLSLQSTESLQGWYWRVARGQVTASSDGFTIDNHLHITLTGGQPTIVEVDGAQELRVAIDGQNAEIVAKLRW